MNGSLSENRPLACGIPQGTILGSLLLLIYINDLPNCLQYSQPRMYADDTNLSFASNSINNIEVKLNDDLVRVNEWLIANKLTLNSSKTEFMLIGSRQRLSTFQTVPSLSIGDNLINQVKYTKSLGVFLDCNLSRNIHVDKLCKKIASDIRALKRIRLFVPYYTLLSIYKSLLQPHFDYCSVVGGNCSKTMSSKLQKLQNRAARILTYSSFDANADTLIEKLGWKKLNSQRQMHKVIMVYNSISHLMVLLLNTLETNLFIVIIFLITLFATQRINSRFLFLVQIICFSFSYSGAVLWNSLPAEMRQTDHLSTFRLDCKNYPD